MTDELFKKLGLRNKPKESMFKIFGETRPLSTFLYFFMAGNYRQVDQKSTFEVRYFGRRTQNNEMVKQAPMINNIIASAVEECESFMQTTFVWNKIDVFFSDDRMEKGFEGDGALGLLEREFLSREPISCRAKTRALEKVLEQIAQLWFGSYTVHFKVFFSNFGVDCGLMVRCMDSNRPGHAAGDFFG